MNTRHIVFVGTFVVSIVALGGACSKSSGNDDGLKQVSVNGVTAPDCVDLYRATTPGREPQGNCAMAYFDAACTKTTFGVAGASTSSAGGAGCAQTILIVAKDYKAAREQFGYPAVAKSMSKRERAEKGYLPNKQKQPRSTLPAALNAE